MVNTRSTCKLEGGSVGGGGGGGGGVVHRPLHCSIFVPSASGRNITCAHTHHTYRVHTHTHTTHTHTTHTHTHTHTHRHHTHTHTPHTHRLQLLEREESVEAAVELVHEVFEVAFSVVYAHYLETQSFPYTVQEASKSLLQIVQVQHVSCKKFEGSMLHWL